ncbi:hypothetical protein V1258_06755 [Brachybacterium sp. J153]|nr:hypothetical protein [Brachybacterium sp. J153]MEE1618110.1 hypothetical protein [Brachybacterium sp. J153]
MSELAVDEIPVAVSLRVLKLSRQPYYRWRKQQLTESELVEACRANALFDAHWDDPECGYRFLAGEADVAGQRMCERTAWRICRANQWWSVFGKKRGKNEKRPGPPVHDDLVKRDFTADDTNELWLTDIPPLRAPRMIAAGGAPSEHWTDEGKLYLCAIKDVFSGRIVGYSISDRMKARLAVNAQDKASSAGGWGRFFASRALRDPTETDGELVDAARIPAARRAHLCGRHAFFLCFSIVAQNTGASTFASPPGPACCSSSSAIASTS